MKPPKKQIGKPKVGEILGGPGKAFGNEKRKADYQRALKVEEANLKAKKKKK